MEIGEKMNSYRFIFTITLCLVNTQYLVLSIALATQTSKPLFWRILEMPLTATLINTPFL